MIKKKVLSIDQMKYLEELGLDISDAYMWWMVQVPISHMNRRTEKIEPFVTLNTSIQTVGLVRFEKIPTYTLDKLMEKIPYKIHYKTDDYEQHYTRVITDYGIHYEDIQNYPSSEPLVGFYCGSKEENPHNSGEMIDVFYDMLVWLLKNKELYNVE